MPGEIHGLLSREEMHGFWEEPGKRVAEMPQLQVGDLDPEIVAHTAVSATKQHLRTFCEIVGVKGKGDKRFKNLELLLGTQGISQTLGDFTLEVIGSQMAEEAALQERDASEHPAFLKLFERAVTKLRKVGWLKKAEAELLLGRLYTPDGQPAFDHVPISAVHMLLEERTRGLPAPTYDFGGATDTSNGVVYEVVLFRNRVYQYDLMKSRKVHEHFHVTDGLEVWDVTYDDDTRGVELAKSGLYGTLPTTKKIDNLDYSDYANFELNEGLKQLFTDLAQREVKQLGEYECDKWYSRMAQRVANLYSQSPIIWRAMVEASLVDATPAEPDAKTEAMARLNKLADRQLGTKRALDKYMAGDIR